ncbi:MAG: 2-oxo acid dehydrogenase subunit E2 [Saprospiraceae bacterium]|nr:2-oxo acid dehydrogenase subunit E2 [Saprospiraceae bacterium]
MGQVELIMPKMGESIIEATIIKWHKSVGDTIEVDETVLEIATDKVDSEIPSPVAGTLVKVFFKEDDVVPVGTAIAMIATEGQVADSPMTGSSQEDTTVQSQDAEEASIQIAESFLEPLPAQAVAVEMANPAVGEKKSDKFYSPLVRNIAKEEGLSLAELDKLDGSGLGGRVTKADILTYIKDRDTTPSVASNPVITQTPNTQKSTTSYSMPSGEFEIIEMDRMRKMIAEHMVTSKSVSPHVTSFVEADVTNIVAWREKMKDGYAKQYNEKLTFTPLFIEAVVKALKDFPKVNCSVQGDRIHIYKNFNIGMATALPSGNLIVPVIKKAELLNLAGLTQQVNDLANRARNNKLTPEDIKDGTFTVTNVGTFGNVMGTPIINQPQAAILALGAIRKKPAVLETEYGDVIAIRQMMFMSLSYDHRIIDGFLGGSFLKRIADYLENFDPNRGI